MIFPDVITIMCCGLMIGAELAVSCFVNPVIWKLDEVAQADALRRFARLMGKVMPVWHGVSLALMMGEAYVRRHAAGLWIAIIVYTITVLVPINDRLAMSGPMPQDLRQEHRRC